MSPTSAPRWHQNLYWLGGVPLLAILLSPLIYTRNDAAALRSITPPADANYARALVDRLRQRSFDTIEQDFDPGQNRDELASSLTKMADLIPSGDPDTLEVVGYRANTVGGVHKVEVVLQYQIADTWLLATVDRQTDDNVTTITGFRIQPINQSIEKTVGFTFRGKGSSHYLMLFLCLGSLALSIYALVVCILSPIRKWKWLWMLITIVGIGRFGIDWNTGASFFHFFMLQFPPAGARALYFGSWSVYVSIPAGAIAFLIRRDDLIKTVPLPPPVPLSTTVVPPPPPSTV